ncbi:MAG: cobaltochelatase subunit CobN [Pseudomonadota bacterium]
MHVLAIQDGVIDTGDEAVDLAQSPGDIVVLSAADGELALLAQTYADWSPSDGTPKPTLRLANSLKLRHNYSVDLYIEQTLSRARLVVVRALGGYSYWPYGLERIRDLSRSAGTACAILPGDTTADATLAGFSTVSPEALEKLWLCLCESGADNARLFLETATAIMRDRSLPARTPKRFPKAGTLPELTPPNIQGRVALIVYRAVVQSEDLKPVRALADALAARALAVDTIYVTSLRDSSVARYLRERFAEHTPDVILNTTAFACGAVADDDGENATAFGCAAPWLQVVLSGQSSETWAASPAGLPIRDIAMHVAMPEFDGRILSRAVAFKSDLGRDPETGIHLTAFEPVDSRIGFTADLAAAWCRLRHQLVADRRVALILPNYPNRDGRIANGVGLDTPASAITILQALETAGYHVTAPQTADALMDLLRAGPTNARARETVWPTTATLNLNDYQTHFRALPEPVRDAVTAQWGPPNDDPFVTAAGFHLALHTFGHVIVGIQPSRGYDIDPKATYHDPALVPPHRYFATYFWLRHVFGVHAVVHLGKHGNLEWLPGKALALSETCYPEAILGPLPNIYPFIVNDPGEGAQAKRRTAAVVVDHLTPPLTRADTYGPLRDLETQLDEYYDALTLDQRRAQRLARDILYSSDRIGLGEDCGIAESDADEAKMQKLDAYLCDLKEQQIRGGLHIFGQTPTGDARSNLLAALLRVPRGEYPAEASLQRAIAADLGFGTFDPLDCDLATAWSGEKPQCLMDISDSPWRTSGDTVERIEQLAVSLLGGTHTPPPTWHKTHAVLSAADMHLMPALDACGRRETDALLAALNGRLVTPGPSGAPTRGRDDVLPTGRNFYSVDARTLPTPTAWDLGAKSAELIIARYVQDHGDWPRAITLSAWGTANMRTGGDDLAQAFALMGAKPTWEPASGRVTGYEIVPVAKLGRPRVDVTLRISGFFRDAFPQQIALLDTVVRAIADRDEPECDNPLRARARAEQATLVQSGVPADIAQRHATFRIFGSKPGAYGAGLQAMFDERIWDTDHDLADAFLSWSSYAYGSETHGADDRDGLERRLRHTDAVVHNQDNREHDILDSDDYYQFAGGLAVAARTLKGTTVPVYHGDHSRPERPKIRSLDEEIARVVRARAVNPKWTRAMMTHGYKGAFELAATVDYLFAFAATTGAVRDHHFDAIFEAYIGDETIRSFLAEKNPDALRDIATRLAEAIERRLWTPRINSARLTVDQLSSMDFSP